MQYDPLPAADTAVMKIRTIARTIAAIVVGYGVIVVITSVGFEMTHGGRSLWGIAASDSARRGGSGGRRRSGRRLRGRADRAVQRPS